MIQDHYQKAMKFAGEKHHQQKVTGTTANYLLHLSNVAMEVLVAYYNNKDFDLEFAIQVAILHDTIEDTDTNYEELAHHFSKKIAQAVVALSKDEELPKSEQMLDSLQRINQLEKEVGIVKLADRITNLQAPPSHWTKEKIAAYLSEAKIIATELSNKNDYLHQRLLSKIENYQQFLG